MVNDKTPARIWRPEEVFLHRWNDEDYQGSETNLQEVYHIFG